jgi:hypothetical protein
MVRSTGRRAARVQFDPLGSCLPSGVAFPNKRSLTSLALSGENSRSGDGRGLPVHSILPLPADAASTVSTNTPPAIASISTVPSHRRFRRRYRPWCELRGDSMGILRLIIGGTASLAKRDGGRMRQAQCQSTRAMPTIYYSLGGRLCELVHTELTRSIVMSLATRRRQSSSVLKVAAR